MIQTHSAYDGLSRFGITHPGLDGAVLVTARSIPAEVRYALIVHPHRKPIAFASAHDLARSIHRRRERYGIALFSTRIPMGRADKMVRVVRVTLMHEGMPFVPLGVAWLGGHLGSQRELSVALAEICPNAWEAC